MSLGVSGGNQPPFPAACLSPSASLRTPTATRSPKRCGALRRVPHTTRGAGVLSVNDVSRRDLGRLASDVSRRARARGSPGVATCRFCRRGFRWRSSAAERWGVLRSEASSSETHCRGARWASCCGSLGRNLPRIVPRTFPLQGGRSDQRRMARPGELRSTSELSAVTHFAPGAQRLSSLGRRSAVGYSPPRATCSWVPSGGLLLPPPRCPSPGLARAVSAAPRRGGDRLGV